MEKKKHFPESKKTQVLILLKLSKRWNTGTLYHSAEVFSLKIIDDI